MKVSDLIDESDKKKVMAEREEALALLLDEMQQEITLLREDWGTLQNQNGELRDLARLAVGALAEIVAARGPLSQTIEKDLARKLHQAVEQHDLGVDAITRQNLRIMSRR